MAIIPWSFGIFLMFSNLPKIASLKSFDNSLKLYPNSGGFYYCHNCYYHSFFPVNTITYNYIQINKACFFYDLEFLSFTNWSKLQTATLIYHTKLLRLISKNNFSLSFSTTRMLAPIFHGLCRILNWFCLCHILRHKNINYMQHFLIQIYSFQLYSLQDPTENHKSDGQARN